MQFVFCTTCHFHSLILLHCKVLKWLDGLFNDFRDEEHNVHYFIFHHNVMASISRLMSLSVMMNFVGSPMDNIRISVKPNHTFNYATGSPHHP